MFVKAQSAQSKSRLSLLLRSYMVGILLLSQTSSEAVAAPTPSSAANSAKSSANSSAKSSVKSSVTSKNSSKSTITKSGTGVRPAAVRTGATAGTKVRANTATTASVGAKVKANPATASSAAVGVKPKPVAAPATKIAWQHEVSSGFKLARESNKYILCDVYTDWCHWCKVLDRETFKSPSVEPFLAQNFVCVKANAEDGAGGQKLASTFKVKGFPSVLVFDSSGRWRGSVRGFRKPEEFLPLMKKVLSGEKLEDPEF